MCRLFSVLYRDGQCVIKSRPFAFISCNSELSLLIVYSHQSLRRSMLTLNRNFHYFSVLYINFKIISETKHICYSLVLLWHYGIYFHLTKLYGQIIIFVFVYKYVLYIIFFCCRRISIFGNKFNLLNIYILFYISIFHWFIFQ